MKRWNGNIFRLPDGEFEQVGNAADGVADDRKRIEPWLSALFQSREWGTQLFCSMLAAVADATQVLYRE